MQAEAELNTAGLKAEADWLSAVIEIRTAELTGKNSGWSEPLKIIAPPPRLTPGFYAGFVSINGYSICERLLLASIFCRLYEPAIFNALTSLVDPATDRLYVETGCFIEKNTGRALLTLQTIIFLAAGNNKRLSAEYQKILSSQNRLFIDGIVRLNNPSPYLNELLNSLISLDKSYYDHFLYGKKIRLDEMEKFPAQLLETTKTFDDLVLVDEVSKQLKTVMNYARLYRTMGDKTGGQLQGYVTMFFGPPGTGKTMTASVIGKELGMDVYAVNLSRVVSKYIGETEKNLEIVFERLGNRDCILFFDEADALFGKRSEVTEANDRYANQEIAYLLQKIDKCNCLVILATNFKQNLDFAFTRRILSCIKIDWPGDDERKKLWEKALVAPFSYSPENLPEALAGKYAITGANIANVTKLACYEALANDSTHITLALLEPFIKLEYIKERRNPNDPRQWPINQLM